MHKMYSKGHVSSRGRGHLTPEGVTFSLPPCPFYRGSAEKPRGHLKIFAAKTMKFPWLIPYLMITLVLKRNFGLILAQKLIFLEFKVISTKIYETLANIFELHPCGAHFFLLSAL